MSVQERNLDNHALVLEAVHERVWQPFLHLVSVIVLVAVVDIQDGRLNVPDAMPQEVDSHHRDSDVVAVSVLLDVLLVGVLLADVLSEAVCLGGQSCFLQLDEHQRLYTVIVLDRCGEIDSEVGNLVSVCVGVLVSSPLRLHHVLLEQSGKQHSRHMVVLHQKLEHRVVYGVGNCDFHKIISCVLMIYFNTSLIFSTSIFVTFAISSTDIPACNIDCAIDRII